VVSKPRISLTSVETVSILSLAELYSIADYSTTAGPILDLLTGGCWTRCQLHCGIRYFPVASTTRFVLASVEGRHTSYPGGILLDSRFLHTGQTDFNSECGRLLGWSPATRWYKVRLCRMKTQEVMVSCRDATQGEFYSIADSSTTAGPIPILFPGGCWAPRQLRNGIRYIPTPSKPMKLLSSVKILPWRNSTRWLIPPQPLCRCQ